MGQGILADSNYVIDYLDNKLPENAVRLLESNRVDLSVINRIELLAWQAATLEQINNLEGFISNCIIHSLSEKIILKTIEIRKNFHLKLPDAIIAATALTHSLILYSRNITDFSKVPGLKVINPHTL
ncbi:MAG: type II toxin-antitoxin system VapC family toxin [Chitinophagaceae bacterium]